VYTAKKLVLNKETLRTLNSSELPLVAGAGLDTVNLAEWTVELSLHFCWSVHEWPTVRDCPDTGGSGNCNSAAPTCTVTTSA